MLFNLDLNSNEKNADERITSDVIKAIIANPINKTFRFITKTGRSGINSGSLKYRIVESKITLLIDALNPLRAYTNNIVKTVVRINLKIINFFVSPLET